MIDNCCDARTSASGCADVWEVGSWLAAPRQAYRLNSLFDLTDGAVITASGHVEGPGAVVDLGGALRPFERLGCPIVVDVCHAVLGPEAVDALVEVGLRHVVAAGGAGFAIAHADLESRRRIGSAGGELLLQPPCVGVGMASTRSSRR